MNGRFWLARFLLREVEISVALLGRVDQGIYLLKSLKSVFF